MKTLIDIIFERLKLSKDNQSPNTENMTKELRDDYQTIGVAYTKAEKEPIAIKYNVSKLRIRDIQLAILDKLRELRQDKKEFDEDDVWDFNRYDVPDVYNKMVTYLDQEPIEFVEYLLDFWQIRAKKIRGHYSNVSSADRSILNRIKHLKKYLDLHY